MCIKAGDLSHACLGWEHHARWSYLVCSEFYAQGDDEESLSRPKSPLCDREKHLSGFAKGQAGFINFLVVPIYEELAAIEDNDDGLVEYGSASHHLRIAHFDVLPSCPLLFG